MKFLDHPFHADAGDIIEVTLDTRANVRLFDDTNFSRFRRGQQARGYGGGATGSPVRLAVPRSGHWHAVVDLGGNAGTVRASARLIKAA